MTIDLLGPGSNATNVTTARPTESRAFGTIDTWFQDCTTPSAGDGTRVPSAWLNAIKAQIVQAIRQSGVTQDNADDLMLWKAIQAAAAANVTAGTLVAVQKFAASGTYTKTSGATRALVIATGGGGAGGGVTNSAAAGVGGGAGSTALAFVDLSGVSTVAVTVGAGGTGSTGDGTAGGTTSFGTYAVAGGGPGGTGNALYAQGVAGGTATAGLLLLGGGAGSPPTYNSGAPSGGGGNGGSSFWGGSGLGADSSQVGAHTAGAGTAPGAGGGGGDLSSGGAGAAGVVLVLEFK